VAHNGPWPRVPASACPRARGDTAVARSAPATCLPASTCSTCSRRPCTPPCTLSSRCRGPKEKPISFLTLVAVAELSPLRSISHRPPLLQASSTIAGSRRYLLVRLRVVVDWGSARAKSATARSRPDATRCSPLPQRHGPHRDQPSSAKERSHLIPSKLRGLVE
jgi:hypothetical protein